MEKFEIGDAEFITREEHEATVAGLVGVLGHVTVTLNALVLLLKNQGIVTSALWDQFVDQSRLEEHSRNVAEAVQRLRGSLAIQAILKDFEGPLQ
jgi:hypothetical protein